MGAVGGLSTSPLSAFRTHPEPALLPARLIAQARCGPAGARGPPIRGLAAGSKLLTGPRQGLLRQRRRPWQPPQQAGGESLQPQRRAAAAAAAGEDPQSNGSESESWDSDNEDGGYYGSTQQQQQQGGPGPAAGASRHPLMERALQLPLELGVAESRTDPNYLERRKKSEWWAKGQYPKVPVDSLEDVHRNPPPLALWQKVAPLALIFFGASFNLTILQTLKDSIMVTVAGAETLPFLSSFGVLPASIGFFMVYGRMVESLPPRAIFYAAVAPLLGFYALFATVVYPLSGVLHPLGLTQSLAGVVPAGLTGLVKVVEYWSFSLFFCMAELWGSVVISVLFWSLANEVCSVSEARAVYPLMGIAANIALVASGSLVKFINRTLAAGSPLLSLRYLVGTVVVMSGVMMLAKAAIDRFVIGPESGAKPPAKKKKKKGSFGESFAVLTSSPKIRNLALLVMSYGVSHRLFEFAWKGQLRVLYPTAGAYQSMLADVSIATGYTTIALMLLGRFVFQYLGWGIAAAATPGVMLAAGGAFFGLSLAANQGISVAGLSPAAMAVAGAVAGGVTQVFARSSKFSLFDPAKEMVYIEMTKEEKSKGKAAVDLVGSQIGKSGAAWLTQALLLALGSITASLPIISFTFVSVITCWLGAVRSLDKQLKEFEAQKAANAAAAAAAAAGGNDGSSSAASAAVHAASAHAEQQQQLNGTSTHAQQGWEGAGGESSAAAVQGGPAQQPA